VLHDLTLALQADRVLVLCDGRVEVEAAHDDPALHAALVATFGGAVRVQTGQGRPMVLPHLDG
jgi:iron complex transport system ATP-binding protein